MYIQNTIKFLYSISGWCTQRKPNIYRINVAKCLWNSRWNYFEFVISSNLVCALSGSTMAILYIHCVVWSAIWATTKKCEDKTMCSNYKCTIGILIARYLLSNNKKHKHQRVPVKFLCITVYGTINREFVLLWWTMLKC